MQPTTEFVSGHNQFINTVADQVTGEDLSLFPESILTRLSWTEEISS